MPHDQHFERAKRCFDVAVSLGLLLALSWLFAVLWLAVACSMGAPVLYRHRRVGRHGREFFCLKFRSMTPDADRVLHRLLRDNPTAGREWQSCAKLSDDPRVTPLGRWLRRSCLDELPQLWNVLRGEMSMVGPRPVTREELLERYRADACHYLGMRPGLTGAWQVHGRGKRHDTYRNRVRLDVQYRRDWSPWVDARLLLRTPAAVLRGGTPFPVPAPLRTAASGKKIVHVLTRFLRAGSEENTLDTCLAQLADGHRLLVVHGAAFDPAYIQSRRRPGLRFQGLPSLVHPVSPLRDLWALWQLTRLLRKERPDVVHTHQSKAGIVGRLAARLAGVPHVVHGIHIVPFDHAGPLSRLMYIALERLAARYTDAFVSVSAAVRDTYLRIGIGHAERHFVVPSGMPLQRFAEARPVDGDAWLAHYPVRPTVVLMLASYEPRKRHAALLDAFAPLAARRPDVHLIFAGSGKRHRIEAMVNGLGLGQRVSVLASHAMPEGLIALADICVLGSCNEGLPRVVVQYLAAGKPVVVSRLPGIDAVVRSGVNGWITAADDLNELIARVEELVDDPGLRRALSGGARASRLQPWDSAHTGASMARIYDRLGGKAA